MENNLWRCRTAFLAALVIAAAFLPTAAQSGRRFPKQPRMPVPEPAAAVETAPIAPPVERKKPETAVRVFSNLHKTDSGGILAPERVHSWTVERLRRVLSLETLDGGAANRSEAIKKAKADEDGAYVVLLDFQFDPFATRMSGRLQFIEVMIFTPVTGKLKSTRRVDFGQSRSSYPGSRNVLLRCYPGAYGAEMALLEASIDTADFILGSFHMPIPSLCGDRTF